MRIIKNILLLSIFSTLYSFNSSAQGCYYPASATYSANGLTVSFQNTSTYPGYSSWDFGDGNTSNLRDPFHTYSIAGTYLVTLDIVYSFNMGVYGSFSCNSSVSGYVTVTSPNIYGCTNSTATNYNASANIDDGSCFYPVTCGVITGVNLTGVIHDRATFNWDNMNDTSCLVDQIRIQYRELGTSSYSTKTMGAPVGNNAPCLNTSKRILNLSPSTQYEYNFKIWYQDGTINDWHSGGTFTTAAVCDNVTNITASPQNSSSTQFCWEEVSPYSFVRLQYREDTSGSSFSNIGGMGVMSPTLCKTKNGLTPGKNYRVMWRTWCNPSGGPYRSAQWDGPTLWTQPTSIRVESQTAINNLDVYPNPSRDIFKVSFTSEDVQDLEVRIINVIGEVIYTENLNEFVGEYNKQVDLSTYAKGFYFLEITTNDGVVNKKLILQ